MKGSWQTSDFSFAFAVGKTCVFSVFSSKEEENLRDICSQIRYLYSRSVLSTEIQNIGWEQSQFPSEKHTNIRNVRYPLFFLPLWKCRSETRIFRVVPSVWKTCLRQCLFRLSVKVLRLVRRLRTNLLKLNLQLGIRPRHMRGLTCHLSKVLSRKRALWNWWKRETISFSVRSKNVPAILRVYQITTCDCSSIFTLWLNPSYYVTSSLLVSFTYTTLSLSCNWSVYIKVYSIFRPSYYYVINVHVCSIEIENVYTVERRVLYSI